MEFSIFIELYEIRNNEEINMIFLKLIIFNLTGFYV